MNLPVFSIVLEFSNTKFYFNNHLCCLFLKEYPFIIDTLILFYLIFIVFFLFFHILIQHF